MKVEYGLASAGPNVEDSAVSLLDVALAGDVRGGEVATADEFRVRGFGFLQAVEMPFRDDEDVSRRLRADVFEGEDVIVFVNLLCGDLASDDAAEEARDSWVRHKNVAARETNNITSPWGMSAEGKTITTSLCVRSGRELRSARRTTEGGYPTGHYQRKAGSGFCAVAGRGRSLA